MRAGLAAAAAAACAAAAAQPRRSLSLPPAGGAARAPACQAAATDTLELTEENVELVLDEVGAGVWWAAGRPVQCCCAVQSGSLCWLCRVHMHSS